jgi:nicotinate-nucleotide pyrophosphorylase (carboxylating)
MSEKPTCQFDSVERDACRRLIEMGLDEDLGRAGDITSAALVPEGLTGAGRFVARQRGVLAGLDAARMVFERVPGGATWQSRCGDGCDLEPGQEVAHVVGPLRTLLAAERLALNFLQRLSGVATLTRRFVDAVAGTRATIYDTRKTTPGWRVLEKHAVRAGGGRNHRMGLHDAVLIKDNHLVAWQLQSARRSLADAVRAARAAVPAGVVVEIEVDSLEQLDEVLPGEPDIVLLDNFTLEQLRAAVAVRDTRQPGIILEASGGVHLDTVRPIAETGVDRISVGALTHSGPALDIALDFEEPGA